MSAAPASGQAAEPIGHDRLQKGREFRFAMACGATADQVAAAAGVARATVDNLKKEARMRPTL